MTKTKSKKPAKKLATMRDLIGISYLFQERMPVTIMVNRHRIPAWLIKITTKSARPNDEGVQVITMEVDAVPKRSKA